MNRVVLGTRGSELALAQSNWVAARLRGAHPGLDVALEIFSTAGDRILDRPLPAIGGKGLFTRELEEALLDGRIDGAVHSLKDLPTENPPGLAIGAVPRRENPADVLVTRFGGGLESLPAGAVVGTSSPRRRAQLARLRPDLRFTDLRGNVPTRLRRVREGAVDATVLAAAGLSRLGLLDGLDARAMPPELMLCAPGQGALALQIRADDQRMAALAAALHDPATANAVAAERAVLARLGVGCSAPLGAFARAGDSAFILDACLGGDDGRPQARRRISLACAETVAPETLGERMAALLLEAREHPGTLAGRRVVVTRAEGQAGRLRELLEDRGAEVFELPVIAVVPEESAPAPEDAAAYDWAVFTSTNAVDMFAALLKHHGRDMAEFAACRVAAVGPATAEALARRGLVPALVPAESVAESLIGAFASVEGGMAGQRVLLPQGNLARPVIAGALTAMGARVHHLAAYRTEPAPVSPARLDELLAFAPHAVAFTSSSTARNFWAVLDDKRRGRMAGAGVKFFSIGPVTTKTALALGIPVAAEAGQHDIPGLVAVMEKRLGRCG